MKLVAIVASIILIFGCNRDSEKNATQAKPDTQSKEIEAAEMKKVTGISGIFFKSKDPKK